MLVPPQIPAASPSGEIFTRITLSGYWSGVQNRDSLRSCTALTLRTEYKVYPRAVLGRYGWEGLCF